MKRKLIFISAFVIIALVALFIIVNDRIVKTPPNLKITYGSREIELTKLPMGWVKFPKGTLVDYPSPLTLASKINASKVEPETILNLNFEQRPSSIDAALWNKGSIEYEIKDNKIKVPKEKGTYVFAVTGYWLKGQVLYVFKVEVK